MTISATPAPARSDLNGTPAEVGPSDRSTRRPFRLHGTFLTVGALAWAAAIGTTGVDPAASPTGRVIFMVGSGLFQVGLLLLLRVLWRTNALGSGKVAKTFLTIENVFVGLAIGSTIVDGFGVSDLSQPGWALLDAFWPLSMIGMFAIAIRIAIAGRWRGLPRFWPLVAESWAICVIPATMVFGDGVGQVVAIVHLVVGYAFLGQIVARKIR